MTNSPDLLKDMDYEGFGRRFLDAYLDRGMGALSKRETDTLVLHLLEEHGELDLVSNHALSIGLRLPESRVKSLRYDARLKYPPEDKKYVEGRFLYVLAVAQFEADEEKIVFTVEDSFVRHSIQAELKARGSISDSSFNRELVKVRVEQLAPVLVGFYGETLANDFIKKMKKVKNVARFTAARDEFVKAAGSVLGVAALKKLAVLLATAA